MICYNRLRIGHGAAFGRRTGLIGVPAGMSDGTQKIWDAASFHCLGDTRRQSSRIKGAMTVMLCFEPLTIAAKGTLEPYYHQYGEGSCQHSFVSSFCMSGKYGDQVCVRDGFLYTLRSGLCSATERVYLFPLGERNREDALGRAVENVLQDAREHGCRLRFETVTESAAELLLRLFPGRGEPGLRGISLYL